MQAEQKGRVIFAGAGPGDPTLLTVRAATALGNADVVITDRLVSREILEEYVNPDALIIPVGKQGGVSASVSQQEINTLLVKMATRFDRVVRLKGGDVSVFSNIMDELYTLNQAGITYEIIPGITALSGAAAYSGIPLTARDFSTGVRILTYYQHTAIEASAWKELALLKETLVFYMSGGSLGLLVDQLLNAGADRSAPFVVIEQATTPNQRVFPFTLQQYQDAPGGDFLSPSLVIIGNVTRLYQDFAWYPNDGKRIPYFASLDPQQNISAIIKSHQNQAHASRD